MISCTLMGGLGNQLFQIFATIAYALEHKQKFGFFYSEHLGGVGSTIKRATYWENFLVSLKIFTYDSLPEMQIQSEKGFEYSKLDSPNEGTDTMLFGYFQSNKYFDSYYQTISRLIRLDKIKKEFEGKNSYEISMHFRLGDYKNLPDHYVILDYEYYQKALDFIIKESKEKNPTILYFCEKQDKEDVEKTINKLKEMTPGATFIKADDAIEDWEQMILMSCCKNNIIANSSFSWWAAYFNSNSEKIICYPEKWFGHKNMHLLTTDLFPDKWHKI